MARLELERAALRALADDPGAPGQRVATELHPVTLHELDRLRRGSRAEALREAVGLWIAREITREVRRDRIGRAKREAERARAFEDRAQRRIRRILDEGLG